MTAVSFTDDPLAAGTLVKMEHVSELRTAVNAVRALADLSAVTFASDAVIRAAHVADLRAALALARASLALPALEYMHPTLQPGVSIIAAVDFAELREGMR